MSIDTDVVDAGDRVAYHRLREKREVRPIRHPRGVIHVLAQRSPLQPAAKLRAQVGGRYQRFGSVGKGRGDHPVDPERTLSLVEVAERLIENPGYQLHVVSEAYLPGRNRHNKRSARPKRSRPARTEGCFDRRFERQPVIDVVEQNWLYLQCERVSIGTPIVNEATGDSAGKHELMRSRVTLERSREL